jgi:hypothetical protein
MNSHFKWLVFDGKRLVAAFVFRDDARQFIELCGCDSMKEISTDAKRPESSAQMHAEPGRGKITATN